MLTVLLMTTLGGGAYQGWKLWHKPGLTGYITVSLDRGDILKTVAANGTLNPVVLVNVGTQVSGTIQRLRVDFNDQVRAGQVLAELDPALFRASLDQSRSNLANVQSQLQLAEANAGRAKTLFEKGYIPRAEWDQAAQAVNGARAMVSAANAAMRRDETNLRYSVIVSPVSGIVVSRNVDVGQTVAASFQTPVLFTIAENLQRMQIDTTVAEADVGHVKVGQPVRFTVDAFSGRDFEGVVRQIRLNPQILQNVVTYDVVIDVANPEEILLPGMTAFVNIEVDQRRHVLRIPVAALRYKPGVGLVGGRIDQQRGTPPGYLSADQKTVYRWTEDQLVPVTIRLGLSDGKYSEVVSGDVHEGDALVTDEPETDKGGSKPGGAAGAGSFRVRMF